MNVQEESKGKEKKKKVAIKKNKKNKAHEMGFAHNDRHTYLQGIAISIADKEPSSVPIQTRNVLSIGITM